MNNKKLQVWLPLLFALVMIMGMYLGYKMRDNMPNRGFFSVEKHRPVQEIMDLINSKYVDKVNMDSLSDTAIQAILSKLDPHSIYIPAQDVSAINDDIAGKFYGIGVEFNVINDTMNVTSVLKDGPGDKAGVLIGDQFIKADDTVLAGKKMDMDKMKNFLRGDAGSKVKVEVLHNNQPRTVTITRGVIPISSVDASYMIDANTGYIKLNKFSTQTHREFMESLVALKKTGMTKLILDLRGNGGGVLDQAVEIADEFLPGDKLITFTEGAHSEKKEYRCRRTGEFETGALAVLADEGTASASEILLGALQDWDRGIIIGRRSFGKGLVQEQYELSDNSALRLTIARYYTPIGRSIQRNYAKGSKSYYDEISNRYHDGETQSADSIRNDTTKIFKTKGGKIVYGGGGITPDYFVAIDTAGLNLEMARIFGKNTINLFAYKFYLQHEAQFKTYKTPAAYISNFVFDETDWQQFVAAATKDSVNISAAGPKEKQEFILRIRAAMARQLWRTEGFYEVYNKDDKGIQKALEMMK